MVRVTCYLDRTGRAKNFLLTRQGVLQAICDAGQYANLFSGTAFLQELQQADFWQSRPRLLPLDEVVSSFTAPVVPSHASPLRA
jgi:hypothetical protein